MSRLDITRRGPPANGRAPHPSWVSASFFYRGRKIRESGNGIQQRAPGVEPWCGSGAKPPEADDICFDNNAYRVAT